MQPLATAVTPSDAKNAYWGMTAYMPPTNPPAYPPMDEPRNHTPIIMDASCTGATWLMKDMPTGDACSSPTVCAGQYQSVASGESPARSMRDSKQRSGAGSLMAGLACCARRTLRPS
jgi:hypothetical protein